MYRLVFSAILLMSLFLLQCESGNNTGDSANNDTSTEEPAPSTTTTPSTTPPATAEELSSPYPSITAEKMTYLFENCDYIDFVFHGTNFSMSQNQVPAIRSTLSGISTTPARVSASCQPVGRVFFMVDGENVEQADLFFGGTCIYYLFLENGAYAYGNQLTEAGYGFYQKIFQQVSTQPSGQ